MVVFLKKNVDVFAWNAYEAPGVDTSFIFHSDAVKDEMMKLKRARAIKEVFTLNGWLTP